jgi:hypothetical protein
VNHLPDLTHCPWMFTSHGCDLADGHPPELGHICLWPENEKIRDQGGYCNQTDAVTFSSVCCRVEADDKGLFL